MMKLFDSTVLKTVARFSAAFALLSCMYGLGFYIGNVTGAYDGRATELRVQQELAAQKKQETCTKKAVDQIGDCIIAVYKESRENQRSEEELLVQREMSNWAWWAMLIGLMQFFATIITIAFVKLTFDETAKAVTETVSATSVMRKANDIASRDARAWLSTTQPQVTFKDWSTEHSEGYILQVDFEIVNHGRLVATNVFWDVSLIIDKPDIDRSKILKQYTNLFTQYRGSDGNNIFPSQVKPTLSHTPLYKSDIDEALSHSDFVFLLLLVCVTYKFHDSGDYHQTAMLYPISKRVNNLTTVIPFQKERWWEDDIVATFPLFSEIT